MITAAGPRARLYSARFLSVQDAYYAGYVYESGECDDSVYVRLAAGKGDDEEKTFRGDTVTAISGGAWWAQTGCLI